MEEKFIADDPLLDTKEHLKNLARQLLKERQERELLEAERDRRVKEIADKLDAMGRGIQQRENWFKKFISDVMKYAVSIIK